MGFITSQFDYVKGKNIATIENNSLASTTTYTTDGKITDNGVYEITFSYSVRASDTVTGSSPHFYIGFGTYTDATTGTFNNATLVRLAFPNKDGDVNQDYPFQMEHTVWVTKTLDGELDFMCSEKAATGVWMYNINAVAKKIADI